MELLYTIKPIKTNWFGHTDFGIYFEDTLIRTTTLSLKETKDIVFLLNTAWLAGFNTGKIMSNLTKETIV